MKKRLSSKAIYAIEKQLSHHPNALPVVLLFDPPTRDRPQLAVSCLPLGPITQAQLPPLMQVAAAAYPLPTAEPDAAAEEAPSVPDEPADLVDAEPAEVAG